MSSWATRRALVSKALLQPGARQGKGVGAASPSSPPAPPPPPPPRSALDVWAKQSDVERARFRADLLNNRSLAIAAIGDASSSAIIPALSANITLLCDDAPRAGAGAFVLESAFALSKGRGTYVPGAPPKQRHTRFL